MSSISEFNSNSIKMKTGDAEGASHLGVKEPSGLEQKVSRLFDLEDDTDTSQRKRAREETAQKIIAPINGIEIDPTSNVAKVLNSSHLPNEIWGHILSFLPDPTDRIATGGVCRLFRQECMRNSQNQCEEEVNKKIQMFCREILNRNGQTVKNLPNYEQIRREFFTNVPGISLEREASYKKALVEAIVDILLNNYPEISQEERDWCKIDFTHTILHGFDNGVGRTIRHEQQDRLQIEEENISLDLLIIRSKLQSLYANENFRTSPIIGVNTIHVLLRLLETGSANRTQNIKNYISFFIQKSPWFYIELLKILTIQSPELASFISDENEVLNSLSTLSNEVRSLAILNAIKNEQREFFHMLIRSGPTSSKYDYEIWLELVEKDHSFFSSERERVYTEAELKSIKSRTLCFLLGIEPSSSSTQDMKNCFSFFLKNVPDVYVAALMKLRENEQELADAILMESNVQTNLPDEIRALALIEAVTKDYPLFFHMLMKGGPVHNRHFYKFWTPLVEKHLSFFAPDQEREYTEEELKNIKTKYLESFLFEKLNKPSLTNFINLLREYNKVNPERTKTIFMQSLDQLKIVDESRKHAFIVAAHCGFTEIMDILRSAGDVSDDD